MRCGNGGSQSLLRSAMLPSTTPWLQYRSRLRRSRKRIRLPAFGRVLGVRLSRSTALALRSPPDAHVLGTSALAKKPQLQETSTAVPNRVVRVSNLSALSALLLAVTDPH